jgi:hypothetical protein
MLGAGLGWLAFSVVVDLGRTGRQPTGRRSRPADRPAGPGRRGRLCPAGPDRRLTYLLPVVFGRGAYGNRKLTGVLEATWPLRVAAVNLGVVLLMPGRLAAGQPAPAGGWRLSDSVRSCRLPPPGWPSGWLRTPARLTPSAEARLAGHHIPSGRGIKVRSAHRGPVTAPAVVMGSQPARREAADHLGRVTAQPRSGFRSGSVRCQAAAPAGSG